MKSHKVRFMKSPNADGQSYDRDCYYYPLIPAFRVREVAGLDVLNQTS